MRIVTVNRHFPVNIIKAKKMIPILQNHLKERWNDLIGKVDDFEQIRRIASSLVDPFCKYVYPKEYEWRPDEEEQTDTS